MIIVRVSFIFISRQRKILICI